MSDQRHGNFDLSQLRVTLNTAKYESATSEAEFMREDSPSKKTSSPQQDPSKKKKQFSQSERTELKKALRVVRAVVQMLKRRIISLFHVSMTRTQVQNGRNCRSEADVFAESS